jgi:hypothetical protein
MAWRLAYSLDQLRAQINAAYPNRSKASDGTIGDAAHASRASDHNPNALGVVCAIDITNDPANGLDIHAVAERIRTNRHPNLKYIISNRRIAGAWTSWNWATYSGSNPHEKHVHFSVGVGSEGQSKQPYDDRTNWNIYNNGGETPMTDADLEAYNWSRVLEELYSTNAAAVKSIKDDVAYKRSRMNQGASFTQLMLEDAKTGMFAKNIAREKIAESNQLRSELNAAKGQNTQLKGQVTTLTSQNSTLITQVNTLTSRVAILEQQLANSSGSDISQETINTINETNAVVKVIKGTTDWIKDKVEAIIRAFSTGN